MFDYKKYIVKYDAWTTRILTDPFAIPLTEIFARTPATPNQITVLSLLISIVSATFFFLGGRTNLFLGAIVWQISFIFDGVDGMLARKTNQTSEFGAKLDNRLDKAKKIINLIALMYSLRHDHRVTIMIGLLVVHYLLRYVGSRTNPPIQDFLHSKGLSSLFGPLDEQFFILFIGPIVGKIYFFILLVVMLQVLNKLVHFLCNFCGSDSK